MRITENMITALETTLDKALPPDPYEDLLYGTDGSHEELMGIFERAYDRANSVALDAIKLLKDNL